MIGRRRDERGVSLILVLVTLVVFGLLVPILGQFGSASGVSGYKLEGQRYDRYAAEAGVQEAIAWAQANRAAGRHGVPCGGIQTGTLGTGDAARSATVKCVGYKDGGIPQATTTAPKFALQTTGTSGNSIDLPGGRYRTNGAWWSNGGISASGVDASRDYVGASGSCGSLQAAPDECDQRRTEPVPDWITNPGGAPAVDRPRPMRCTGGNHVIPIEPGFHWQRSYFDMVADGVTENGAGCSGGYVLWLQPGNHYFDFDFYGADGPTPSFRAAGSVVVVGGTPSGWDPYGGGNQFTAARTAVRARSACDPGQDGATVVMAGASYFELNPDGGRTADAQICGRPLGTVPVSFAQLTHGSAPSSGSVAAAPTSYAADGHGRPFDWQPRTLPNQNLLLNRECNSGPGSSPCGGGQVLIGSLTGDNALGTLTMSMADPIPEGVHLTSLRLIVNHREQDGDRGGVRDVDLTVTGLGDLGGGQCDFRRFDQRDDWPRVGQDADVYTCDLRNDRIAYFHSGQPIRIGYEVRLDRGSDRREASANLAIDQVRLEASFDRPTYRASAPTQPILKVDRNARATFDGAVYTPTGSVDFDWAGSTQNGFRGGAIVQSVKGYNLPGGSEGAGYSPFELPGGGSYTDRVVTFAATVSGSDQTGALLTARVLFCDPVPGLGPPERNPKCTGVPDEQPYVLAWQARR